MRFQTASWAVVALVWAAACVPVGPSTDGGAGDVACVDGGCDAPAEDAGSDPLAPLDGGVADGGQTLQPRDCGALPAEGLTEGFAGRRGDTAVRALRRVVLMGGSVEVDGAAEAFASSAAGGDLLVLRASGAVDTYTPWFFSELNVQPPLSSAATLRLDDANAGAHPSVLCRVEAAEALWLAGGDQWDYLGAWPTALQVVIGQAAARPAAMGGTSAGARGVGQGAFDAEAGSVTSAQALADPLSSLVSVQTPLTAQPELAATLVDTHFTARDREGRLLAFLAVYKALSGLPSVLGVGLDERAALVIEGGRAQVSTGAAGRYVWLYGVEGSVSLQEGAPLSLAEAWRARVQAGTEVGWPPSAASLAEEGIAVEPIVVDDGVVQGVSP